jgi:hypothetical protein
MIRSRFPKRITHPGCWKFLGLSLLVGALVACKPEPPVATIVVVNKKMPLVEWPDSTYIADLDSILALEPLKKQDKNKPSIAMNTFKAPNFILPSSVTGKKPEKGPKADQGTRTDSGKSGQSTSKSAKNNSAENFANQFTQALSALQSDPSNSKLYRVVESKDGEDLFQLLRRTYGAGAQSLPRFYVLSTLQSVNPGVMLEHLNAGDKVRVPRL